MLGRPFMRPRMGLTAPSSSNKAVLDIGAAVHVTNRRFVSTNFEGYRIFLNVGAAFCATIRRHTPLPMLHPLMFTDSFTLPNSSLPSSEVLTSRKNPTLRSVRAHSAF
jgi:hypothetical protein